MRGLAGAGCEFQVVEAPLEEPFLGYYRASARMWNQLRREFLYAAEQVVHLILGWSCFTAQLHFNKGHHQMHAAAWVFVHSFSSDQQLTGMTVQAGAPDDKPTRRGNVLWRSFWGAHQRFFRHLCMAAKVPGLVRMANVRSLSALCSKRLRTQG